MWIESPIANGRTNLLQGLSCEESSSRIDTETALELQRRGAGEADDDIRGIQIASLTGDGTDLADLIANVVSRKALGAAAINERQSIAAGDALSLRFS
jgi:hypothetical protein